MATDKVNKHAVQLNKILENNTAYTRKNIKSIKLVLKRIKWGRAQKFDSNLILHKVVP